MYSFQPLINVKEAMPRAKRNAERGEQTRAAIVAAAVELFGERGFRGTSISQIAQKAGVVQSVLHHHFGSKEQLLNAALASHYRGVVDRPDMEAIAVGQIDFFDEMMRVTEFNHQHPDLVRFFSVMTGEALTDDHPAQLFFKQRYDAVRAGFVSAIAKSKGIDDEAMLRQISEIVTIFFAVSDGLQMQWLRNPDIDFVGGVKLMTEMLRHRLTAISS